MKLKKVFPKKRFLWWLLCLALVLPTLLPLFRSDFFHMHDFTHVARLVELDVVLKAGLVPPRWAPDFGWGYGMPLFHFYPPLPYYVAEVFYLVGFKALMAIKLIFGLNFLLGFYFMYLWAKESWGKWGGLVSAVAFTYLPYRAVQFYVRGALAELTAMTFLPLFFYASGKLIQTKKAKFLILTSMAITGVFLSHNVIALFALLFFPVFFVFQLFGEVSFKKSRWQLPWKVALKGLAASLLALGLSAFFVVPAFWEQEFTIVKTIAGGYSHYSLHFIYLRQLFDRAWAYGGSVLGPFDDISFQIGWPHVVFALGGVAALFKGFKDKNRQLISLLTFLGLMTFLSVFMMTFHAKPIWDKLEFIHIVQFPWRFLAYVGTFAAFLSGSIWVVLKNENMIKGLAVVAISLIVGLNVGYFRPEKYLDPEGNYYTDRRRIATHMSGILFDYIPPTAQKNPPPAEKLLEIPGEAELKLSRPGDYLFEVNVADSGSAYFNKFYFPGWQVLIDDQEVEVKAGEDLGRVTFAIPQGEHQVAIKLGKTPLQKAADGLSLVSWLGLLGIGLWQVKERLWS